MQVSTLILLFVFAGEVASQFKVGWCDDLADLHALDMLQFVFMNYTCHCVIGIAFTLYRILGEEGEVAFTVTIVNRLLI